MSTAQPRIYLDYHATTPVDPRVYHAMEPYFTELFGNPASKNHAFGREASGAVERARAQVAALIGAVPKEIIFTSGATESDNLAIKGVARQGGNGAGHIVTLTTEHKAVLDPCNVLQHGGTEVTYLEVGDSGRVDLDPLRHALRDDTMLVSVMHANNEIGVIQPVAEIGALCRERGIPLHVDAAQSVGKISVDVAAMNIDLLSISGHKLYASKGIGALYVRSGRPRLKLQPQMDGGGHERGLRSGTLPVALIVGLGLACEICDQEMEAEAERITALRNQLVDGLLGGLADVRINGDLSHRLPGNANMRFAQVDAESLLRALPNIALSTGSACTTANLEPSHVLKAIGLDHESSLSSVRFGLGRFTTAQEVATVVNDVIAAVKRLRDALLIKSH